MICFFFGESIVVDATGEVMAKTGDKEQIMYVDVDVKKALEIRNQKLIRN